MPITVIGWWTLSVALGLVVVAVVALLLLAIIRSARSIDRYAQEIWLAGKNIAANTVAIQDLETTNKVAGQILEVAKSIDDHSVRIEVGVQKVADSLRRA